LALVWHFSCLRTYGSGGGTDYCEDEKDDAGAAVRYRSQRGVGAMEREETVSKDSAFSAGGNEVPLLCRIGVATLPSSAPPAGGISSLG
jgi:hypothetical protein